MAGDDIVQLLVSLRNTAENHLAQVSLLKSKLTNISKDETISSQQLLSLLNNKDYLILDVRPKKEFLQAHIVGALNVQPDDIEIETKNLDSNKTVVAYCRGPYCVYSYQMIEALQKKGMKTLRLEEGFPEWKAAGLPFKSIN